MRRTKKFRLILLSLALYLVFSLIAGILIADGTLHPARPLTQADEVRCE